MGKWNSGIRIDGVLCFLAASMLLILPLKWAAALFAAALIHECAHALAVMLTGGHILGLRLSANGACMQAAPMTGGKELVCTLAGPLASFLLLLGCRVFPRLAVCGALQGAYNLLPIYPLDGWRILNCFCGMASGAENARKVSTAVDVCFRGLIAVAVMLAAFTLRIGWIPMVAVILFLCSRKIPCKDGHLRVQ